MYYDHICYIIGVSEEIYQNNKESQWYFGYSKVVYRGIRKHCITHAKMHAEYEKLNKRMNDLDIIRCPDIVLIDARDNKLFAYNVKSDN